MSLNKYDPLTGTLTTLANGQRIWLGTKAAHDAAEQAGTLPDNALIAITDDGDISGVVDEVEDGNMNPVTSNAVYDFPTNYITESNRPVTSQGVYDAFLRGNPSKSSSFPVFPRILTYTLQWNTTTASINLKTLYDSMGTGSWVKGQYYPWLFLVTSSKGSMAIGECFWLGSSGSAYTLAASSGVSVSVSGENLTVSLSSQSPSLLLYVISMHPGPALE